MKLLWQTGVVKVIAPIDHDFHTMGHDIERVRRSLRARLIDIEILVDAVDCAFATGSFPIRIRENIYLKHPLSLLWSSNAPPKIEPQISRTGHILHTMK